jgi:hypothetical protein
MLGMTDFIVREAYCGPAGFTYVVRLENESGQRELVEEAVRSNQQKPGSFRAYLNPEHLAFAYVQTGEPRYRKVLMQLVPGATKAGEKSKGQISRALAAIESRGEGAQPPAAITDLEAERQEDGRVKLTWTTPKGATRLQVKSAPLPIVDDCNPDRRETNSNWWSAENFRDEPAAEPGKKQSMLVSPSPAKTNHFAIRSYDRESNRSAISNIATLPQ